MEVTVKGLFISTGKLGAVNIHVKVCKISWKEDIT